MAASATAEAQVIALEIVGAASGEKLGHWELPATTTVKDVKSMLLADCEWPWPTVDAALLYNDERLKDSDMISSCSVSGTQLVLGCIKIHVMAAMADGLDTLRADLMYTGKKGVSEIKAYAKPPDAVMKTMVAVMTLLDKVPSWAEAKTSMGDGIGFIRRLQAVEMEDISPKIRRKMSLYMTKPDFTPESVENVSGFAGKLCQWVRFLVVYAEVAADGAATESNAARTELKRLTMSALNGSESSKACMDQNRVLFEQYYIRKCIGNDVEEFRASRDFEVLTEIVTMQAMLPFVSIDVLSGPETRQSLEKWASLMQSLACMLFEHGSELQFPLDLILKAREMQRESTQAEEFLKDLDSCITLIASLIEPNVTLGIRDSDQLSSFFAQLVQDMEAYCLLWKAFIDFCDK